jgi:hypothetical protein
MDIPPPGTTILIGTFGTLGVAASIGDPNITNSSNETDSNDTVDGDDGGIGTVLIYLFLPVMFTLLIFGIRALVCCYFVRKNKRMQKERYPNADDGGPVRFVSVPAPATTAVEVEAYQQGSRVVIPI